MSDSSILGCRWERGKRQSDFKPLKSRFKPFNFDGYRISIQHLERLQSPSVGFTAMLMLAWQKRYPKAAKENFTLQGDVFAAYLWIGTTTDYHGFTTQRKFQTYKMGVKDVCLRWYDDFRT